MWIRKIGQKGNAEVLVLPAEALRALGWERGDYIVVRMESEHGLLLTKANLASLPDRVLRECEPVPVIFYD